jgi:hypothetical protein
MRPPFAHDLYDLRDHVACALNDHRIAHPHVLAVDFVLIVERGVGDGDSTHVNRSQARHRCQRPRAPDLGLNARHDGGLLLRRELEGDGPARRAGQGAELGLVVEPVHLGHGAVDFELHAVAGLEHALVVRDHGLHPPARLALRADGEAPSLERREDLRLGAHAFGCALPDRVGAKLE